MLRLDHVVYAVDDLDEAGARFREAFGLDSVAGGRLADEATANQILIEQRLYAEVEAHVEVAAVGSFTLKGFQRPVPAFDVVAVRAPSTQVSVQRS